MFYLYTLCSVQDKIQMLTTFARSRQDSTKAFLNPLDFKNIHINSASTTEVTLTLLYVLHKAELYYEKQNSKGSEPKKIDLQPRG